MKLTREQKQEILDNAPEGAEWHSPERAFVYESYFNHDKSKVYIIKEKGRRWVDSECCDTSKLTSISGMRKELERKAVVDAVNDMQAAKEKPVEWVNGCKVYFNNHENNGLLIGIDPLDSDVAYILHDAIAIRMPLRDISRESPEQKAERERTLNILAIVDKFNNYAVTENYTQADWDIVNKVASCVVDAGVKLPTESK